MPALASIAEELESVPVSSWKKGGPMGRVLVTGADGFIGSHLAELLVRQGHDVRAMALYNSFGTWGWLEEVPPEISSQMEIVLGDIRDPELMHRLTEGCSAVIHLAALIAIPYSYRAPRSYIESNVLGTLNLLQSSLDNKIEKFIHTSTSEVYGTAMEVPITESHPLRGQSPYSASKIAADQIAHSFHASFELPVVTIRPFNTYGPRQSARAVIPSIISQIAGGQREISLGTTSPTRDFTYVADTCSAFLAALVREGCEGQVINLGTGHEISVLETAELIARLMNTDVRIISTEERVRPANSEVERLCADNSRAKSVLGWEPEYQGRAGLEAGLAFTIQWFTNPANLRIYKPSRYQI